MGKRFHDGHGQFVPLKNLPNVAISFAQALERKVLNRYQRLPWIPFSAAKRLDTLLKPDDRVWEIGAGWSTFWLADRVGHVTAIEADKQWNEMLKKKILSEGVSNIDLRYEYHGVAMSTIDAQELDLLYVDGGPRKECLLNGFSKVRAGGLVYCDNTDDANFWGPAGFRGCLPEIQSGIASIEYFTDYVPGMVAVNEGALIHVVG